MNDYYVIVSRAILLYFSLLLLFRLMGKREIGELSILDLVVFIMVGDMAVMAIDTPSRPFMHSLVPILVIVLIQLSLALLSLKSQRFRKVIEGKPAIIINKGKIDEHVMKKQRYNFDDLLTQLRGKNILNIEEIEYAILEPSGQLSVIERKSVHEDKNSWPFPLIIDGKVQEDSLSHIGKSQIWLRQQLKKRGYEDMKRISICTYGNGVFYIDEK